MIPTKIYESGMSSRHRIFKEETEVRNESLALGMIAFDTVQGKNRERLAMIAGLSLRASKRL